MKRLIKYLKKEIHLNPVAKWVLIALPFCIIISLYFTDNLYQKQRGRVEATRIHLLLIRKTIEAYKEEFGNYPDSIDDVRKYASEDVIFFDFKDEPQSDIPEHGELNGKGGYYYNKETGEVRLNLTNPVKEYFKFYIGPRANEIPSEW